MAAKTCSDEEFVRLFQALGATATARQLGVGIRSVYSRRTNLSRFEPIASPAKAMAAANNPARIELDIQTGIVLVGGDGHYWAINSSTTQKTILKITAAGSAS